MKRATPKHSGGCFGRVSHNYAMEVGRAQGKILFVGFIGIILPYSLLRTSKGIASVPVLPTLLELILSLWTLTMTALMVLCLWVLSLNPTP